VKSLERKIRDLEKELDIHKLKCRDNERKVSRLTKEAEILKQYVPCSNEKDNVLRMVSRYVQGTALEIIGCQIENHGREAQGRRFTDVMKLFSLALEAQGPQAYKFLSEALILPSKTTLERITSAVDVKPGLCFQVLAALKKKVESMTTLQKHAIITFDEIALKTFLEYKKNEDFIEGFANHGPFGSVPAEYASQALVVCVHGLHMKWKQPIGYLLSNASTPDDVIHRLLMRTLDELEEAGLNVRAIVCDQGTCNQSLFNHKLKVSVEKPFIFHNNKKIFTLFDAPHLLKSVRNNLIDKDFVDAEGKEMRWDHVRVMVGLETEKPAQARLCPKLGQYTHVEPSSFKKMRVKYASQVFSNTAASAMMTYASDEKSPMPGEALHTAGLLKRMDSLFDSFNSHSKFSSKPYKCALTKNSIHITFLKEMSEYFKNLKSITAQGKISRPPCFNGWRLTISALLALFEDLSTEGMQYLKTRNLSQDCLENLFGVIRQLGGSNCNPTSDKFRLAFKHVMLSDALNLRHSGGTNCELNSLKLLIDARALNAVSVAAGTGDAEDSTAMISVLQTHDRYAANSESFTKQNIDFYLTGVCVNKFLKKHRECSCIESIHFSEKPQYTHSDTQLFTVLKAHSSFGDEFGALKVPTNEFFNHITRLSDCVSKHFDGFVRVKGISAYIHKIFSSQSGSTNWFRPVTADCSSVLHEVERYFITTRIYFVCKTLNQAIVSNPKTKRNRKYKILRHE
jgi:hypothetical protein